LEDFEAVTGLVELGLEGVAPLDSEALAFASQPNWGRALAYRINKQGIRRMIALTSVTPE